MDPSVPPTPPCHEPAWGRFLLLGLKHRAPCKPGCIRVGFSAAGSFPASRGLVLPLPTARAGLPGSLRQEMQGLKAWKCSLQASRWGVARGVTGGLAAGSEAH